MSRTIEFLFDFISPYAYLASTQIRPLAARHGAAVEAVPILLGPILATNGSRGPAEVPVRRDYLFHDVTRLARFHGVAINPAATHPFNPLAPLRAIYAVDPVRRWDLVEALYRATWVQGRRVDKPEVVAAVASEAGFDVDALAAAANSELVKTQLRAATDKAIARGVFGVPSMLVGDELFWGVDSLHLLERHLAGKDATDADEIARWRVIQPSITRK